MTVKKIVWVQNSALDGFIDDKLFCFIAINEDAWTLHFLGIDADWVDGKDVEALKQHAQQALEDFVGRVSE